jgi:pyruvate kinase
MSGLTAKRISARRPSVPTFVVSTDERVVRQCHALWGIKPILQGPAQVTDELFDRGLATADAELGLEDGDNVVVIAGTTVGKPGSTNSLRVMTKGDVLLRGTVVTNSIAEGKLRIVKDAEDASELQPGEIAALFRLFPDFDECLRKAGGILLATTEYDERLLEGARARGIPVIIDVHGIEERAQEGQLVKVVGSKGVVLRK